MTKIQYRTQLSIKVKYEEERFNYFKDALEAWALQTDQDYIIEPYFIKKYVEKV